MVLPLNVKNCDTLLHWTLLTLSSDLQGAVHLKGELYWSESKSDVAWNRNLDFSFVCLHQSDLSAKATLLQNGLQPNSNIKAALCGNYIGVKAMSLRNGLQPNFQAKLLLLQCKHTTEKSIPSGVAFAFAPM